jgi:hypothetical protein
VHVGVFTCRRSSINAHLLANTSAIATTMTELDEILFYSQQNTQKTLFLKDEFSAMLGSRFISTH